MAPLLWSLYRHPPWVPKAMTWSKSQVSAWRAQSGNRHRRSRAIR